MTKLTGLAKRNAIWRHNGFFGSTRMAARNMDSIIDSDTATDDTKLLAGRIRVDLECLMGKLKIRNF